MANINTNKINNNNKLEKKQRKKRAVNQKLLYKNRTG